MHMAALRCARTLRVVIGQGITFDDDYAGEMVARHTRR